MLNETSFRGGGSLKGNNLGKEMVWEEVSSEGRELGRREVLQALSDECGMLRIFHLSCEEQIS